jgi:hypothetical protein
MTTKKKKWTSGTEGSEARADGIAALRCVEVTPHDSREALHSTRKDLDSDQVAGHDTCNVREDHHTRTPPPFLVVLKTFSFPVIGYRGGAFSNCARSIHAMLESKRERERESSAP